MRASDVDVQAGFPGPWRWRTVFAAPDRYAWIVDTTGEPTQYLFDGHTVRAFVGSALTSEDPSPSAALRSHARFMGALWLDGLAVAGTRVRTLPAAERPPGAAYALEAVFPDAPARYVIAFDAARQVLAVEGPVALPPFGDGLVRVEVSERRRVDGVLVPFRLQWTVDGRPLADERTRAACVLARPPAADAFAHPARLPRCE